jgi:hypothetical protein
MGWGVSALFTLAWVLACLLHGPVLAQSLSPAELASRAMSAPAVRAAITAQASASAPNASRSVNEHEAHLAAIRQAILNATLDRPTRVISTRPNQRGCAAMGLSAQPVRQNLQPRPTSLAASLVGKNTHGRGFQRPTTFCQPNAAPHGQRHMASTHEAVAKVARPSHHRARVQQLPPGLERQRRGSKCLGGQHVPQTAWDFLAKHLV